MFWLRIHTKKWRESPFFPTWCHMLSDYRRLDASSFRDLPNVKPVFLSKILSRKYTPHISTAILSLVPLSTRYFWVSWFHSDAKQEVCLKPCCFFASMCSDFHIMQSTVMIVRLTSLCWDYQKNQSRASPGISGIKQKAKWLENAWKKFNSLSIFLYFKFWKIPQHFAKVQITSC